MQDFDVLIGVVVGFIALVVWSRSRKTQAAQEREESERRGIILGLQLAKMAIGVDGNEKSLVLIDQQISEQQVQLAAFQWRTGRRHH